MRPRTLRLLVATVGALLAGPAAAQWWNPFDGGPAYDEPPADYGPPPGVYADPPPDLYVDPPPDLYADPPPGWGTPPPRLRRVPPADLPYAEAPYADDPAYDDGGSGYSNRRRLPPPDYRFDPDGRTLVRPDEGDLPADPYANDPYGAPDDPYGPPPGDGRGLGAAPPPMREPAIVAERALDALRAYLPAKRAAVAEKDPFRRAAALRTANIWLVGHSVEPATAATIGAVDRVLGIDVSDAATTALPPAGTAFVAPEVKRAPADDPGLARLADYARDKTFALLAGAADGPEARAAEARLAEGIDGGLDAKALAGLDAYLGLGGGAAVVLKRDGDLLGDDGGALLR